jgi:hypothetical protein
MTKSLNEIFVFTSSHTGFKNRYKKGIIISSARIKVVSINTSHIKIVKAI